MVFQIWMVPAERSHAVRWEDGGPAEVVVTDDYPVFVEALTPAEAEALGQLGYRLEHEFEATRDNAEAYFVGWCDNMADVDNGRDDEKSGNNPAPD